MSPRRPELWEDAFLVALQRTGRIRVAAELADVNRAQVYRRLKTSPEFAARVESVFAALRDERTSRAASRVVTA